MFRNTVHTVVPEPILVDKRVQVTEMDLGVDIFQKVDNAKKEHFATLVEEIINAFNKEKEIMNDTITGMAQKAESDNQGSLNKTFK